VTDSTPTPAASSPDARLVIGVAGLAVAALLVAEFLVRVSLGPRPSLSEQAALADFARDTAVPTITIVVIDTFMMAFLIVFLTAFRRIIASVREDIDWVTAIVLGAGMVFVGITLVGDSLEAGAALNTVGAIPDPVAIRTLTEGYLMLFGPIGSVLIALIALTSGYVIFASGALPRWTGRLSYIVAALNVIAIPTAYGGTENTDFYSVGGWGVAAFATFPWLAWVITVSVTALRERRLVPHGFEHLRWPHQDRRTGAPEIEAG
jgi:hypothetical protein